MFNFEFVLESVRRFVLDNLNHQKHVKLSETLEYPLDCAHAAKSIQLPGVCWLASDILRSSQFKEHTGFHWESLFSMG